MAADWWRLCEVVVQRLGAGWSGAVVQAHLGHGVCIGGVGAWGRGDFAGEKLIQAA